MAAPANDSVAALASTTFGGDSSSTPSTCLDDPNFATICSFIQNFGEIIRIGRIPFDDLQHMLENSADAPLPLIQLHVTLLRRVFKTVTPDKWERSLAKFGHTYCSQDAWEIERFGYKKAKIQTKLRLLKNLLEAQFDYNVKFKAEVNKLQAADLRLTPLGRDTEGQVYWYQVDEDANLRVYREDIDDETWEIVASSRDELEDLISQLQRGEVKKPEPEEAIIVPEEDSNSKDDIEPKEIILDTGKVDEEGSTGENSSESEEEDSKQEKKTVEPLIIKHSFNINNLRSGEVEKVKSDSVDDVQYEISNSNEREQGLKMVFGLKSRPKVESVEPVVTPEVSKPLQEETLADSIPIDKAQPSEILCSAIAPPPAEIVSKLEQAEKDRHEEKSVESIKIVPKLEQAEKGRQEEKSFESIKTVPKLEQAEKDRQEEKTVESISDEPPVKSPKKIEKSISSLVDAKFVNSCGNLSSELTTKAEQRELNIKANKNLRKSAKVNSIVERLKNLPDSSVKTIADLIPPPASSKEDNLLQKQPSLMTVERTKPEAFPVKVSAPPATKIDDAVSLPMSGNDTVDSSTKHLQTSSIDLTKVQAVARESKIEKTLQFLHKSAKKEAISVTDQVISEPLQFPLNLDGAKESGTSIISDSHTISFQKDLLHSVLKDSQTDMPESRDHSVVPMDVDVPSIVPAVPVVENPIEKKATWTCGEDDPVQEELIVKKSTWVCGDSEERLVKNDPGKSELIEVLAATGSCTYSNVVADLEPEIKTSDDNPPLVSEKLQKVACDNLSPDIKNSNEDVGSNVIIDMTKVTPSSTLETVDNEATNITVVDKDDNNSVGTFEVDSASKELKSIVATESSATPPTVVPITNDKIEESSSHESSVPSSVTVPTTSTVCNEIKTDSLTNEPTVELDSDNGNVSLGLSPVVEQSLSDTVISSSSDDKHVATSLLEEKNDSAVVDVPTNSSPKSGDVEKIDGETKPVPSEIPSTIISEIPNAAPTTEIPTHTQENIEEPKTTSDVPPPVTTALESVNEANLIGSQDVPETESIKNLAGDSLKCEDSVIQSVSADNHSGKGATVDCEIDQSIKDDTKRMVEKESTASKNALLSSKVNSSLVLYSESSKSGDDDAVSDNVITSKHPIELQSSLHSKDNGPATDRISPMDEKVITSNTSDIKNEGAKGDAVDLFKSDLNTNKSESNNKIDEPLVEKTTLEATVNNTPLDNTNNQNSELDTKNSTPSKEKQDNAKAIDAATLEVQSVTTVGPDLTSVASVGTKRKADEEVESLSKVRKLDDTEEQPLAEAAPKIPFDPIVGETVEEQVMTITGEGSGAMNEGRNSPVSFNPICGETIEEEVMTIVGDGFGVMNQGSNENSPVSLAVTDVTGSQNESIESDESRDAFTSSRGRGGRRGRGKRGRPAGSAGGRNSHPNNSPRSNNRGARGSREVARLGVSVDSLEVNGDNERPVRASRRIAQIRLKEEEERRKLEEERLAQLKAAQIQKKAKQEEKEKKKGDNQSPVMKVKKGPGRKSQKDQIQFAKDYVPESESEDNSEEEEDGSGSDEFSGKLGKSGKRRRRRKNGKAKKTGNPWATSDEDEEEEQVEEEEEYHYEEEEEEDLVFKSDHEFSPESDLGEDGDIGPSRHARTAKQDKGDLFEEGNCCKCGKGDHPEWILLCDKCDKGWHASCLRPQLWVVPEGEWFCPPCQHNMLIENLSKNLVEYEGLLKKRENEILRKQRLAYVGISLDNVLPDKEPEIQEPDVEHEEKVEREKRKQRRRILSDEELSDDFINDGHSDDDLSRSRSGSSEDSEDEPVYRLRARRTKKAFNFKEYDDMINSALRVDDDEEVGEEVSKMDQDDEDAEDEEEKVNGEDEDDHGGAGGGKNDAYLKHLEKQAQEEDETDEELLDEKERLRRKELKKQGQRKTRRRINDLDAYSDEEDSDDDFKASEAEDDEEELAEEGESEWSGDKMEEDSDDSIAKRARRKDRQGRHGRLGRREKYSDKGLVRRSTRKRRSRISYDESDDEDDEDEDQNDKWQSGEESEEEEESESNSESDDATWGKRKKKGFAAKPKLSNFVLGASSGSKGKGKGGVKRKKRKTDEDDVDRAWNSARGKKEKDEPVERRTRGRKINFKDILDSGESDDDGNVRPKRRPLSDSDDSRSPSSSRRLAEEIRAENARRDKEYEEAKAKAKITGDGGEGNDVKSEDTANAKDVSSSAPLSTMPESLTVAKLAESSVNKVTAVPKVSSPPATTLASELTGVPLIPPSPNNIPPVSSPLSTNSSPLPLVMPPVNTMPLSVPPISSPIHLPTHTPPISLLSTIANVSNTAKLSDVPSLQKSPPPIHFVPKSVSSSISAGLVLPHFPTGPVPLNVSARPIPPNLPPGHVFSNIPPNLPTGPIPPHISNRLPPPNLPVGLSSPNVPIVSARKSSVSPIPPPVPVPTLTEKKSSKQSKRGSRGSKSEKQLLPPVIPPPSDLELALTKPVKAAPTGSPSSKSSSKKKDRGRESPVGIPNSSLLMAGAGGVLPELLGMGMPASLRPGAGVPGSSHPPSGSSSSKKEKRSSSSRTTQQTTPPPVSQNLSPSLPIDIDRVPNPALFQGNPGMRAFHPMWGVRNPGPPPQAYSPSGSPVPASMGKPPPLNTSPFSGQQGPQPRPGFSSPPPLRIPNPNTSPLQAFQHFKRDGPLGGPLYRLPPGQQPGVPLSNILPPGMMSPHAGGPERFFAAPPGYPHPYGLLPPHSQGPPQALFPFDYRGPPEPPFKDEPPPPPPPRTTASSLPTPVSSASSSPPPTTSASVPLPTKDEASAARDSEFGGLVSYFSSQRSEEDMDT